MFPSLMAGILVGVLVVIDAVSIAALVFSGPLAPYMGAGVALSLLSVGALLLVATVRGSHPAVLPTLQDTSAILQALLAGAVATALGGGAAALPTVGAALALSTALTGVGLILVGRLRLGGVIRFLPYPVLGGFLAGTGWLIVVWTLPILTGEALTLLSLPRLFSAELWWRWLPGTALGVLLVLSQRRWSHPLVTPGLLAAGFLLFGVVCLTLGVDESRARELGLLLGGQAEQGALRPLWTLGPVDFSVLMAQIPTIGALVLVTAISALLNTTAVELSLGTDLDMDREITRTGEGNLLAGLVGGSVGFVAAGVSALAHRAGARSRATGLAALGVVVVALLLGASVASYLPTPVVGGLLLSLGFAFLIEWLYDGWYKLPAADWLMVLGILVAIAGWGFFVGLGVGLLVATGIFVVNYSRVEVVRSVSTGRTSRSNVERSPRHEALLRREGDRIQILTLHGYLFFGVAQALLDAVDAATHEGTYPREVVLDFRQVLGMDSSAALALQKVVGRLSSPGPSRAGAMVVFAGLRPASIQMLERGGCPVNDRVKTRSFPDADRALEWCENRTLAGLPEESSARVNVSLDLSLVPLRLLLRLKSRMEILDLPAGAVVCREGDAPNALYFVVDGRVTAWLQTVHGPRRIALLQPGAMAGEVGWCQGTVRTTNLTAEIPSRLYRLPVAQIERLAVEDPAMLIELQRAVMRVLAVRLTDANQEIEGLRI